MLVDAVAGGERLALPEDLPALLLWTAVSLPLRDARGKKQHCNQLFCVSTHTGAHKCCDVQFKHLPYECLKVSPVTRNELKCL